MLGVTLPSETKKNINLLKKKMCGLESQNCARITVRYDTIRKGFEKITNL